MWSLFINIHVPSLLKILPGLPLAPARMKCRPLTMASKAWHDLTSSCLCLGSPVPWSPPHSDPSLTPCSCCSSFVPLLVLFIPHTIILTLRGMSQTLTNLPSFQEMQQTTSYQSFHWWDKLENKGKFLNVFSVGFLLRFPRYTSPSYKISDNSLYTQKELFLIRFLHCCCFYC